MHRDKSKTRRNNGMAPAKLNASSGDFCRDSAENVRKTSAIRRVDRSLVTHRGFDQLLS